MNKVTLLAIIALTMLGSLVFKAWQRAPVLVLANPQPKTVAVASVENEEFRLRLRQIIARAKAASEKQRLLTEKSDISDGVRKGEPEKTLANP